MKVDLEPSELYMLLKVAENVEAQGVPGVDGLSLHYAVRKLRQAHESLFKEASPNEG